MQVHYNLLGAQAGAVGSDRSGIRLRLTDGGANFVSLTTDVISAPVELPCADGESGPLCERQAAVADVRSRFGDAAGAAVDELNTYCNGGGLRSPGPPSTATRRSANPPRCTPSPGTCTCSDGRSRWS